MKIFFLFLVLLLGIIGCNQSFKEKIQDKYLSLMSKTIMFPKEIVGDSTNIAKEYKIVLYVDSMGCLSCKLQLPLWREFIRKVDSITNKKVQVMIIANSKSQEILDFIIRRDKFPYPIINDSLDVFNMANMLPTETAFRCFLLDETNHVILIGNPINNQKIRELYIRTICERLGIEQPQESNETQRITNTLGVFDWRSEQHTSFTIHNDNNESMYIDSLYTSCECTTATIDKRTILPKDSAVVHVSYRADKPEEFLREIYAEVRNKEQIVMTIEGEAVE